MLQHADRAGIVPLTQESEGTAKPGVVLRKRVGIMKSSHRNVRGGPGSDPPNRAQLGDSFGRVGASVDVDLTACESGRKRLQCLASLDGPADALRVSFGEDCRGREQVCHHPYRLLQRRTESLDKTRCLSSPRLQRHLLTEHGAKSEFGAIDASWDS